jgi:hypothetical protein
MGGRSYKHHSKVVWPGFSNAPAPRHIVKIGRNDPCPCESGKKYKDCHERAGSAWLEKLAREESRRKAKDLRARMKESGVPWWKRLFVRE